MEALTGDAPGAIAWLEWLGVEFSREGDGYRLARCGGATAQRLLQVGDRTGHAIAHALRGRARPPRRSRSSITPRWVASSGRTGISRATSSPGDDGARLDAAAVVLAAGGRCYAEARTAAC